MDNKEQLGFITGEEEMRKTCTYLINKNTDFDLSKHLILLELSLFTPYLGIDNFETKFYERMTLDSKYADFLLEKYTNMLEVSEEFIKRYRRTFKSSIRSISGLYKKILVGAGIGAVLTAATAGIATPFIATLAAPAGLSGAAALSSGLAVFGGGAIATGGLGMTVGAYVIIGGGAVFGVLGGSAMGVAFSDSPNFTLLQASKLEVVMKDIILFAKKDMQLAKEMIQSQQEVISELEKQLCDLKCNESENKERIKTLTKSIGYLRNLLNNCHKLFNDIESTV